VVSFGLPDPLSFRVRGRATVAADRGQTSTGKASGSGCKRGLTRHLGECDVCKDTITRPKRKESKTGSPPAYGTSNLSVATQNLINMVTVSAVSGTVLLGLPAAKHF
jgi:hypothetical protein